MLPKKQRFLDLFAGIYIYTYISLRETKNFVSKVT